MLYKDSKFGIIFIKNKTVFTCMYICMFVYLFACAPVLLYILHIYQADMLQTQTQTHLGGLQVYTFSKYVQGFGELGVSIL